MIDDNDTSNDAEEQQARAKLRESFLRAVMELKGQQCRVLTYEKSTLNAVFRGLKSDGSDILVKDLETPAGVKIPSALLRTPDVLAIQFDKPLCEYE